jgi:hypothetical protein
MRIPCIAVAVALLAGSAHAGELEVAVLAGKAFPFYSQQFTYDPGPLSIPGLDVQQSGVFSLDAHGALTLSLAAAWQFAGPVGIEGRLDSADVSVDTTGAVYHVSANLPAPLPDISTDVDLGNGTVDLDRLKPVSLNLRLRTPGKVGVAVSGGVSWLPSFRFTVRQPIGLGLPSLGGNVGSIVDVATVAVGAEASPEGEGQSRFGGNVGATLRVDVAPSVTILGDARYFWFQKETLHWGATDSSTPLPALQDAIVGQIAGGLEPIEFNPQYFHAAIGVALRF